MILDDNSVFHDPRQLPGKDLNRGIHRKTQEKNGKLAQDFFSDPALACPYVIWAGL